MASAKLIEELNCPICLEVYTDPVTLRCGHNFCRGCIHRVLDTQQASGFYTCPVCRKRFPLRASIPLNMNLRNIAERFHLSDAANIEVSCTFCDLPSQAVKTCLQCETSMCERHLQRHNRTVQHTLIDPTTSLENRKCPVHKKILEYYCTEDSTFLCAICGFKNDHQGHKMEPLDSALAETKDRLRKVLEKVNSKTEETEKLIQNLQEEVQKVQGKADVITKGINELFKETRRQLEVLEKNLISDILSKKEETLRSNRDLIQKLEKDKEELLKSQRRIEELCDMTDPFKVQEEEQSGAFQDVRSCVQSQRSGDVMDERLISRALKIGLADITSGVNMCFYMQEPTDLLMDITTAAKNVQLSPDLRSAIYKKVNPETLRRFQDWQVLSSRSLSSGRHYWDVDSSNTGNWRIGVCYPSMARRGDKSNIGYNRKSWCLRRFDNELEVGHNGLCLTLPHVTSCNMVRVYLDYEAGQLSFYERGAIIRHLHTYTATFTEPLHAAFLVYESSLRIRTHQDRPVVAPNTAVQNRLVKPNTCLSQQWPLGP